MSTLVLLYLLCVKRMTIFNDDDERLVEVWSNCIEQINRAGTEYCSVYYPALLGST